MTSYSLQDILQDSQKFHSSFQIDHFIINGSGIGKYGKYKQCLREIEGRITTLQSLFIDQKRTDIHVQMKREAIKAAIGHDEELLKLDLLELLSKAENLSSSIRDSQRELERFYRWAVVLKNELEKEGKSLANDREELESKYWKERMELLVALDMAESGRMSKASIEGIHSLLPEMSRDIFNKVKDGSILQCLELPQSDSMRLEEQLREVVVPKSLETEDLRKQLTAPAL